MLVKEKYEKEVVPQLMKTFNWRNKLAVPKILKVTVNIGAGRGLQDAKFFELVESTLVRITGQKPAPTKAKKSISAFKVREGQVVGYKVTLRGARMFDFLNKLIHVSLPRVRDFHGLDSTKLLDRQGNMSLGFKEHIVFPEIRSDEVERLHGLEICITTSAQQRAEGLALFQLLGFPFKK